jgi:hypothetical protein
MAQRNVTITLRDKQTTGGSIPGTALMGEPFINLYDGVLKFSAVTGGGFEPSTQTGVFEVGSALYNQKITNRLNINDNFIISGDTGKISTYQGTNVLSNKFLSGTSTGFVLADITDIAASTDSYTTGATWVPNTLTLKLNQGKPDVTVSIGTFNTLTATGATNLNTLFSTTVSGGTLFSGSTNVGSLFVNTISNGTNTTVGGSANHRTVNLVDSPSVNNITYSGTSTGGNSIATNVSATTLYSGSTNVDSLFVKGVSAGSNTTIGGSSQYPIVNIVASPSFNNITYSGTSTGGNSVATNVSATTGFYSAGTSLETIIYNIANSTENITSIGNGLNTYTAGTANAPTVNISAATLASLSVSGATTLNTLFATTVSGGTLFSGSTNIGGLFVNTISNGTNTTVGGSANHRTVNLVDSPSLNNITYSGISTGGNSVATNVSATTFFSGSTNLGTVINSAITGITSNLTSTRVQPGTNITTGGTANNPTINLVDSPSVNGLTVSGTGNFTGLLQSGGTTLGNLFVNDVTAGTNISIGGSANHPTVNVISSPVFAGLVSATGFTDSSLTAGRVIYAGVGGRLTDEAGFTYDANADTLNTKHITVGAPGQSGTSATIYGDVLIIGQAISGFTSELYIEDNNIFLNYNPTASTVSTSLGAGWSIQDGDGVAAGDVFFDIRGTATGVDNRSFATNLNDLRIRETGTVSAPNGVRVLAELDLLDGGSY